MYVCTLGYLLLVLFCVCFFSSFLFLAVGNVGFGGNRKCEMGAVLVCLTYATDTPAMPAPITTISLSSGSSGVDRCESRW